MASSADPKPVHSPLAALLERLEQGVHLKKQELLTRLGPIESALRAYQLAVEHALARDFAESHGLAEPRSNVPTARAAAEQLLEAVRQLPELRSEAVSTRERAEPAKSQTAVTKESRGPGAAKAKAAAEQPASLAFPKIFAKGRDARLVVVGALSGRRKNFPDPWADALEWLDTSSGGTHAVGNLATRIKQGRVFGLVICDRAIQHKHSEPLIAAARAKGVPIAFADQGGAAGVLRAFETIEGQL